MSQATELLGKSVYYFLGDIIIFHPRYAQIIHLEDSGTVTLMVPDPWQGGVEYKRNINYSSTPIAYHWSTIEDYEEWEFVQRYV